MISSRLIGHTLSSVSDDLLADVYESGMTLREIAAQLKVSPEAIRKHLRKVNTSMRARGCIARNKE